MLGMDVLLLKHEERADGLKIILKLHDGQWCSMYIPILKCILMVVIVIVELIV
jgi:hypothetical protein